MTDGRKRITRLLAGLGITALGGSMLVASSSSADPNIGDVQARVDALYSQAEMASERLNEARDSLVRAQTRLKALRADLHRKRTQVEGIRGQVVAAAVAKAQGQGLSSTAQIALSGSPDAFLQRLVIVSQYDDQQSAMQAEFATEARQLEMRQAAATRQIAEIAQTRRQLAAEKASIDQKAKKARDLLQQLKATAAARAAERVAAASRSLEQSRTATTTSAPTVTAPSSASGRARIAVDYALAHVGDAYVWGASGPSAFDCSGLTMMAWQQAGVSLPHSSTSQMSSGVRVSQSQLQPGDLVFYYSPVHHVGIYIGNGKIVHAANPSDGVLVAPVFSMPYSGAVRPG